MAKNTDSPNQSDATDEQADDHEVDLGETMYVEAAQTDNTYAFDAHHLVLKDPDGRAGHLFNCRRCGGWYYSTENFTREPCIPVPIQRGTSERREDA